jgi:hypothetical protein
MTQPKATKRGLPRHVLAKPLKDGATAYYWNSPPRARDLPGAPAARALGSDLLPVVEMAATLRPARPTGAWTPQPRYALGASHSVKWVSFHLKRVNRTRFLSE